MMGNPYLDEISWSKIEVDNEFTGGGFWVFDRGWKNNLPSKIKGAMINGNDIDRGFIIINNPKFNSQEEESSKEKYYNLNSGEWLMDIDLKGGKLHQKISQIGQRDDASDGYDRYDLPTFPSLPKAFNIKFDNDASRDIRSSNSTNNVWKFTLDNEYSTKSILTWSLRLEVNQYTFLI